MQVFSAEKFKLDLLIQDKVSLAFMVLTRVNSQPTQNISFMHAVKLQ